MLEVEADSIAQARRLAKRLRVTDGLAYAIEQRTLTVKVMKKEDPK